MTTPPPTPQLPGAGHQPPPSTPLLSPLEFGALLGQSFSLLWKNPVPLLAVAGVTVWVANLVTGALTSAAQSAAGLDGVTDPAAGGIQPALVWLFLGALLLQLSAALAAQVISQSIALQNVRTTLLGDRATTAELWRLLRTSGGPLLRLNLVFLGISIVCGMVLTGLMALVFVALFSGANATLATLLAIPLSLLIAAAVAVPMLWLMFRLSLAPSVIVFEGGTVRTALRRSWQLVHGRFWRVAGIQLLISLMFGALGGVLMLITTIIAVVVSPTDPADLTPALLPGIIGSVPVYAAGALGAVLSSTAIGLLYVDARFRDDWLWTALNGYAAARVSGVPAHQLSDPFITPPAPPTAFPGI